MNKYTVIKSENVPARITMARSYNDGWYSMVEDPTVPVGFRILVVDNKIGGNILQRDITIHNGNNSWTRIAYLYTENDPVPEFHRNGRLWLKQVGAAKMAIAELPYSANNYANRKFYDKSSLLFGIEYANEIFNVPGKVQWEYQNNSSSSSSSSDAPSLFESVISVSEENEENIVPLIRVQHRFRTVFYRQDEPIAMTPSAFSSTNFNDQ
jgi:hypothetical protein